MKDHTVIEITGIASMTILAVSGLIIDGEVGNSIAIATSGAVGTAVGAVFMKYRSKKEAKNDEVQ